MPAERVQKLLAGAGLASRRTAEEWVRAGRVRVDGAVARLGDRADPAAQVVTVDGRPLRLAAPCWWMANKPAGVLTTVRDASRRRTVVELLPPGLPRLFPVGRLDLDTEGLVLLTNDGAAAHAVLHPSLGSEREYLVTARGRMPEAALRRLAAGVALDDGLTAPARVGPPHFDARADTSRFMLVLREGRKRQIRRALAALGHPVVRLVRTRMGPQRLGRLPTGGARPLTAGEVRALERHAARLVAERQPAGKRPGQAPPAQREAGRAARAQPQNSGRDS